MGHEESKKLKTNLQSIFFSCSLKLELQSVHQTPTDVALKNVWESLSQMMLT